MGITFVEKGDRGRPRPHAKVALVLAGGAISGGAFKIGGLIALNTLLANRSVTDLDIYVGISAGAFLAAPLAAGVGPEEMLKSLEGASTRIDKFSPAQFYRPNWREFISRPLRFGRDAAGFLPLASLTLGRYVLEKRPELLSAMRDFVKDPTFDAAEALVQPLVQVMLRDANFRPGLSYMPSGLFVNSGIEEFIREQLRKNGVPNDFRLLHMERGKSLYIGATHLDTAEGVVFGHDEDASVSISEAVQASSAIPGFYKPARIRGKDYLDAGVRRTANISLAVKRGAQLVIAYNPFRPFVNYNADQLLNGQTSLSDMGVATVINQAFRTLLHTRLMLGIEKLQMNPNFHGDVILLEPSETDVKFFQTNPLNFWARAESAMHGYISATEALERHSTRVDAILKSYGIRTDYDRLRERVEEIRASGYDDKTIMRVLQRDLHPPRQTGLEPPVAVPLRVVRS